MKRLRSKYACPTELALEFVGGKWKTVILSWLKETPHRYSDLRRKIPNISEKVLTQRLHDLEMLDLVCKAPDMSDPSIMVWRLTPRGDGLRPMLDALYQWGLDTAADMAIEVNATGDRPLTD